MKSMLLMLIVSICLFAWRAPDYLEAAGLIQPDPAKVEARAKALAEQIAKEAAANPKVKPMSAEELMRLSKTDPQAYQKFLASRTQVTDRGEVDKLMNFFKSGEYK